MNHRPGQMLDAVAWVAWALTGWLLWEAANHPPQTALRSLRICGAELGPQVADEPWICTRAPHPDTEAHRASDGTTWTD
ncbi:MAG: hypothetical protein JO287_16215 [Pseudonocardiales bacterium]|nr:hypothetical protein [Pseudonocardiales bacterium]